MTNKVGITQFTIGEKQTGNVSINLYDRTPKQSFYEYQKIIKAHKGL